MTIRNNQDLSDAIEKVNLFLQEIQDYVGNSSTRPHRIRFPRGHIRTARYFRSRVFFVIDEILQRNISYALMLHDLHHWILTRMDLIGTVKEMLIKDAIVLLGNIAETLTRIPMPSESARKKSYNKRTQTLESMRVISASLHTDLKWLWETRCKCHIYLAKMHEYSLYTMTDYNRAVTTLRSFCDALEVHYTGVVH